ncbi:MAG: CopG family transcriptional regulator [Chloroflexi bacterium]|nr:CopG family transcriptional regulator [Chloroflexota bacterium]
MKRATFSIDKDTYTMLRYEARRRGVSVSELIREAVMKYLPGRKRRKLSFIGIARGPKDLSTRVDEVVRDAILKHKG